MEGKKFVGGLCGIVVLILLGGLYKVTIMDDRIIVSLPSDVCNAATLRVTKDDFTLKCGRYIAFQADTIVEYWRTYGQNELGEEEWWVRNNRFVGLNKKHITLELNDYGDYFDIVRRTRYRKGRQNIDDGILLETYTFTKDKVKITYNYEVNNKALHRISMRIKKHVDSYLDAFDPNGYTGVRIGNLLSYEGYGNMIIDPTVKLTSPTNYTTSYNEGDSISLTCQSNTTTHAYPVNVSLWWNALDESDWHINETVVLTGNATTTFSKTIPHPTSSTFLGTFEWNCQSCNGSGTANCSFQHINWSVDPRYKPEVPTISSPNTTNLNLLNGSIQSWGAMDFYEGLIHTNSSELNHTIYINWSHPGLRDNNTEIIWNLSYYGSTNSTRIYDTNFRYSTANTTIFALFNVSNLASDLYYVTLRACNEFNETLCEEDSLDIPIDIFDYNINISTGETKIRFSPQPTITKGAALGQTASAGIISVDWLGYRAPDGKVNISINLTEADKCMDIYAYNSNTPGSALHLANLTYVTAIDASGSDPDYIWLWATKANCGTTTLGFSMDLDLFFGGNVSGGT